MECPARLSRVGPYSPPARPPFWPGALRSSVVRPRTNRPHLRNAGWSAFPERQRSRSSRLNRLRTQPSSHTSLNDRPPTKLDETRRCESPCSGHGDVASGLGDRDRMTAKSASGRRAPTRSVGGGNVDCRDRSRSPVMAPPVSSSPGWKNGCRAKPRGIAAGERRPATGGRFDAVQSRFVGSCVAVRMDRVKGSPTPSCQCRTAGVGEMTPARDKLVVHRCTTWPVGPVA
jgi:hypothetical protein